MREMEEKYFSRQFKRKRNYKTNHVTVFNTVTTKIMSWVPSQNFKKLIDDSWNRLNVMGWYYFSQIPGSIKREGKMKPIFHHEDSA